MNLATIDGSDSSVEITTFEGSDLVDLALRVNTWLAARAASIYLGSISIGGSGHGQDFVVTAITCDTVRQSKSEDDTNWYLYEANTAAVYIDGGAREPELARALARVNAWVASRAANNHTFVEHAGSSKGQVFAIMALNGPRSTVAKPVGP